MSTLDRLRQLVRGSGSAAAHAAAPATPLAPVGPVDEQPARELTYEPVNHYGLPMPARPEVPALPGASMINTPAGRCVVIDHTFEADSSHGRLCVEHASVTSSDVIAFCERDMASLLGGAWGEGLGRAVAGDERSAREYRSASERGDELSGDRALEAERRSGRARCARCR